MSLTSVDLPDTETPVTLVKVPSGIRTGIPLRLCSRGLWIVMAWPLPFRRVAGTRAEVHHVVGVADRLLVVLDDEHRVAEIPEPLERLEQAPVVPLVQSDGRLVEDVEHADETRPDLCRQTNSLPLSAGERARGPVQGEIVEADVHEEA